MVEPVSLTLGAITVALISKASDKATDKAVDVGAGALGQLVRWLRERFSDDADPEDRKALANAEEVPDSPARLRGLAVVLDRKAEDDPGFARDLQALVDRVSAAGVDVGSMAQMAWGDQNVQASGVVHSEINVTYGQNPPAR